MVNLPPPESNDQQPTGQPRDNDEAIAIAIALLSVGAILWWGWTRGESIFAPGVSLPQLPDSPSLVEDETLITVTDDDIAADAPEDQEKAATKDRRRFLDGLFFLGNGQSAAPDNANPVEQPASDAPSDDDTVNDDAEVVPEGSDRSSNVTDNGAAVELKTGAAVAGTDNADDAAKNGTAEGTTESAIDDTAATTSDAADAEPAPLPELSISDVSEDYWAYPYIDNLFEADLLPDFPSGTLQPDKQLTRAELAALLNKSIVADVPSQRSLTFSDVPSDHWAANDIKQVVDAGYMTGFPGGLFQPDEIVPRYQVYITMATGLELSPPADVDDTIAQYQGTEALPAWAKSQVAAAASQGMIVNHPDPQRLAPQAPATRADLIATIHQALVIQGRIDPIESP